MSDMHPPESVYNLIPEDKVHIHKPPRYMSKFRPMVVLEKKLTKDTMKTMGPAKVEVTPPENYLKKHSKEPKLLEQTQSSKVLCTTCTMKKPAVPKRTEQPPMGIHTKRDFLRTTTAVPMRPQPTYVDSKKGHKQHLENSGLVPKYIKKKDYGEVPEYLHKRNEEEQRAQEEYDNFVKEQKEQGAMKHLSDVERQAILEGLKKNWDELHHEYQGLSLVTNTLSKKARKERLEIAMKQLENDIDLFERFKTIYIPNN
ncbi:enkurin [Mastacembelus armatus]|uniref:Enkurin, TRPC channel interacting protein n=1 Tax=Mastacembelus armatus TaxID=205130 RepID=A0A3Q3LS66_9TELE|nr:enkurin [Mastacembelus armatus]